MGADRAAVAEPGPLWDGLDEETLERTVVREVDGRLVDVRTGALLGEDEDAMVERGGLVRLGDVMEVSDRVDVVTPVAPPN